MSPSDTAVPAGASGLDWEALRAEAIAASARAYAPYSRYPVGAAAVTTAGRLVSGCNVENAAYGVVLCAECGVVSDLLRGGQDRTDGPVLSLDAGRELLVALSCVDGDGTPITPCGRCRQLLWEHAAPGMLVQMPEGDALPLSDLLPHAFGAPHLGAVETAVATLKGEA